MLNHKPILGIPAGEVPISSYLGQPHPYLANVGVPTGHPHIPQHGYAYVNVLVPMPPQQGYVTQPQATVSAAPLPVIIIKFKNADSHPARYI